MPALREKVSGVPQSSGVMQIHASRTEDLRRRGRGLLRSGRENRKAVLPVSLPIL